LQKIIQSQFKSKMDEITITAAAGRSSSFEVTITTAEGETSLVHSKLGGAGHINNESVLTIMNAINSAGSFGITLK
jgi:hypothetical protein